MANASHRPRSCSPTSYAIKPKCWRTLFTLTVVTVLALPMTIIPGLFGMNVAGVPFSESRAGFWIVALIVVTIVGIGAALASTLRRRY